MALSMLKIGEIKKMKNIEKALTNFVSGKGQRVSNEALCNCAKKDSKSADEIIDMKTMPMPAATRSRAALEVSTVQMTDSSMWVPEAHSLKLFATL